MNKHLTYLKPLEPITKEVKKINKKQPEIKERKKDNAILRNRQSITSSFHWGMALLSVTEILEIIFLPFLSYKYMKSNYILKII